MEPQFKLSRQQKVRMILRYLKGCLKFFIAALVCACLTMAFHALTPQVIRITVDTVLKSDASAVPQILQSILPVKFLLENPGQALWIAAGAVLLLALLRGVFNYGQRVNLSKGSEASLNTFGMTSFATFSI